MDVGSGYERIPCPACGGAGGGPFGRAGGAWDDEEWMCPRCEGVGMIALTDDVAAPSHRPGLVKAAPDSAQQTPSEKKRKASA